MYKRQGIYHAELFDGGHVHWEMFAEGVKLANGSTEAAGLLDVLYLGVKLGVVEGDGPVAVCACTMDGVSRVARDSWNPV